MTDEVRQRLKQTTDITYQLSSLRRRLDSGNIDPWNALNDAAQLPLESLCSEFSEDLYAWRVETAKQVDNIVIRGGVVLHWTRMLASKHLTRLWLLAEQCRLEHQAEDDWIERFKFDLGLREYSKVGEGE